MKTKHIIFSALTAFFLSSAMLTVAQSDLGQLLKGTSQDANTLVKGYMSPVLSAVGYGLNQGWYTTAKPHKIAGFDLTVTGSFVNIPTSDLSYYVDNSKMKSVERLSGPNGNPQSGYVPTVFGSSQAPYYDYKGVPLSGFQGAPGADLSQVPVIKNTMPVPMAQFGFGLPKGFEIKLRYVPKLKFGDKNSSDFSLFGIGLMHDVKQYIPGIKSLPFDLSGFVGYTKLSLNVAIDAANHPDQKGTMSTSATTIQGVISKKFAVLTGYAGLGYNIASSKLAVSGTYTLLDVNGTPIQVKDPVNFSASSSGPRATFGLRLKLAIFNFNGEYTLQKYNTVTLGFGISVR
jgi:hypothetical protein